MSHQPLTPQMLLQAACNRLGFVYAEIWRPRTSNNGTMLCLFATSANEEDADDPMRAFASESRRISLSSGSGLPGRVWATRQPEWSIDVRETPSNRFVRVSIAKTSGLAAAVGIPLLSPADSSFVGVAVFFAQQRAQSTVQIMQALGNVGAMLAYHLTGATGGAPGGGIGMGAGMGAGAGAAQLAALQHHAAVRSAEGARSTLNSEDCSHAHAHSDAQQGARQAHAHGGGARSHAMSGVGGGGAELTPPAAAAAQPPSLPAHVQMAPPAAPGGPQALQASVAHACKQPAALAPSPLQGACTSAPSAVAAAGGAATPVDRDADMSALTEFVGSVSHLIQLAMLQAGREGPSTALDGMAAQLGQLLHALLVKRGRVPPGATQQLSRTARPAGGEPASAAAAPKPAPAAPAVKVDSESTAAGAAPKPGQCSGADGAPAPPRAAAPACDAAGGATAGAAGAANRASEDRGGGGGGDEAEGGGSGGGGGGGGGESTGVNAPRGARAGGGAAAAPAGEGGGSGGLAIPEHHGNSLFAGAYKHGTSPLFGGFMAGRSPLFRSKPSTIGGAGGSGGHADVEELLELDLASLVDFVESHDVDIGEGSTEGGAAGGAGGTGGAAGYGSLVGGARAGAAAGADHGHHLHGMSGFEVDVGRHDMSDGGGRNGEGSDPASPANKPRRVRKGKELSFADVSSHFDLPLTQAAERLNVCVTLVKRVCRENGVSRWPYRKLQSRKKKERIAREATQGGMGMMPPPSGALMPPSGMPFSVSTAQGAGVMPTAWMMNGGAGWGGMPAHWPPLGS